MSVSPIPEGYNVVSPYLIVDDVHQQLEFLKEGLGAEILEEIVLPDGSSMHGEARVGDSVIMMGKSQEGFSAFTSMIHIYTEDCDAAWQRAIEAGAKPSMPPQDQFYGNREGGVIGPCGNHWWFGTRKEVMSKEEMAKRAAVARGQ